MIRGVRGATTVSANDALQIADRTRELIRLLVEANGMKASDIASAIFTVTDDLDAAFPAVAARDLPDWKDVPLSCAREIPVPGSLGHCIRILIHWNTDRRQDEVRHVYVRAARGLRPQWALRVPGDEDEEAVVLEARRT
ncbi:MAG TPA: chorismate mutase [Thermoanaerobaculia bacterium]|nr:chorismate mutase [Thermoanaerobaculia bacterium]